MAVDAREPQASETTPRDLSKCQVVTEVTPGMILQDLAMGRDRQAIADRYVYLDEKGTKQPFELWMVNMMFEDPLLKGKRPTKVKRLPFVFQSSDPTNAKIADLNDAKAEATGTTGNPSVQTVLETETAPQEDLFANAGTTDDTDSDFTVNA